MDCEKIMPLLSAYIDKELSAEQMAVVEQHLPLCPDCAKRLRDLRTVTEITGSLAEISPTEEFSQKLRQSLREELSHVSPQSPRKPLLQWPKMTVRAILGLASAVAGVIALLLFLNTFPQRNATITTSKPAVSERAVPQFSEPLGKSAETADLAGRPRPQVKTTQEQYTVKEVRRKFQNLPVWREFAKAYKVSEAPRFQAAITRYLSERARPQGETTLSMIKSLSVAQPPPNADFIALPSYLEKARFNHKKSWVDVWIIVLNWQSKYQPEAFLERGRIYVVNAQTQEILFSTTF